MLKSCFSPILRRQSRGNVLFIILIAIVLFAALAAAITKTSTGSGSMDREKGTISASEIMGYGSSLEKAVAKTLGNDISEGGLSFENTAWQFNNGNPIETAALFPNCTQANCKLFNPSGGGLDAQTFPPQAMSTIVPGDAKSGHSAVYSLKVTGVGSSDYDLVLMVAGIDKSTCMRINTALGIENLSNAPPSDSWAGAVLYNGSFTGAGDASSEIGDTATQIVGKSAGCINRAGSANGAQDNYFYQVLLPR